MIKYNQPLSDKVVVSLHKLQYILEESIHFQIQYCKFKRMEINRRVLYPIVTELSLFIP